MFSFNLSSHFLFLRSLQLGLPVSSYTPIPRSTKHIDIQFHFVREAAEKGLITIDYVPTADMCVDIMTKPLPLERHTEHMRGLGLRERSEIAGSQPQRLGLTRGQVMTGSGGALKFFLRVDIVLLNLSFYLRV